MNYGITQFSTNQHIIDVIQEQLSWITDPQHKIYSNGKLVSENERLETICQSIIDDFLILIDKNNLL